MRFKGIQSIRHKDDQASAYSRDPIGLAHCLAVIVYMLQNLMQDDNVEVGVRKGQVLSRRLVDVFQLFPLFAGREAFRSPLPL